MGRRNWYERLVEDDIRRLARIQVWISERPWIERILSRIVSKYPWRDIVLLVWILYGVGVWLFGRRFFWVGVLNAILASLFQRILEVKRPVEYDRSFVPSTDLNAESYGFPTVETFTAVAIIGEWWIQLYSTPWMGLAVPIGLLVVFFVGFSRVYSCARFPHQVIGSAGLGLFGLLGAHMFVRYMKFERIKWEVHLVCIGVVAALCVVYFTLGVENNDSRLMNIPREEFLRVMTGILSGGEDGSSATVPQEGITEIDNVDSPLLVMEATPWLPKESERSSAMNSARNRIRNNLRERRETFVRSDSLYYLQKSMEERERRIRDTYGAVSARELREIETKYSNL